MRRVLVILLIAGPAACDEPAPIAIAPDAEEPERVFIFEGVEIEQRRGGRTIWSGTAQRADGDLDDLDVSDVQLTYIDDGPDARRYQLQSPSAHLALEGGEATFDQVRITDEHGGRVDAGRARYDEKEACIVAAGPVLFSAQGLEAHATSGVVHLERGAVEIAGPIVGRFVKPRE
jgi:hypothetical protein